MYYSSLLATIFNTRIIIIYSSEFYNTFVYTLAEFKLYFINFVSSFHDDKVLCLQSCHVLIYAQFSDEKLLLTVRFYRSVTVTWN